MGKNRSESLFVVAKCAQTIDGKIATRTGQSKWITSGDTRKYARKQRDRFDAILVGIDTVIKDDPRLTGIRNKNLQKIVVDSSLRISTKARLFKSGHRWIVATTRNASLSKKRKLEDLKVQVIQCPAKNKRVDLNYLSRMLLDKGIKKLLIEGGATIIGAALKEKIIHQMHIYIAPKIVGDSMAKNSIDGLLIKSIKKTCILKIRKIRKFNKDILVVADVHRNR
ncbi:MAG: RibD family protein [Candidatus Omnitrophota bacterium]